MIDEFWRYVADGEMEQAAKVGVLGLFQSSSPLALSFPSLPDVTSLLPDTHCCVLHKSGRH